jgi:hypothetical protein
MSEKGSYLAILAEKIIGIALIVLSGLMLYYTATSTNTLGTYSGMFGALGVIILIVGIFLLIVKPAE